MSLLTSLLTSDIASDLKRPLDLEWVFWLVNLFLRSKTNLSFLLVTNCELSHDAPPPLSGVYGIKSQSSLNASAVKLGFTFFKNSNLFGRYYNILFCDKIQKGKSSNKLMILPIGITSFGCTGTKICLLTSCLVRVQEVAWPWLIWFVSLQCSYPTALWHTYRVLFFYWSTLNNSKVDPQMR